MFLFVFCRGVRLGRLCVSAYIVLPALYGGNRNLHLRSNRQLTCQVRRRLLGRSEADDFEANDSDADDSDADESEADDSKYGGRRGRKTYDKNERGVERGLSTRFRFSDAGEMISLLSLGRGRRYAHLRSTFRLLMTYIFKMSSRHEALPKACSFCCVFRKLIGRPCYRPVFRDAPSSRVRG